MNNDPNSYLRNLQHIATEQDRAKFASLVATFRSTLERLPKMREEIDAYLAPEQALNYISLIDRIEPKLKQAEAFLTQLDTLPDHLKNDDEILAFAQATSATLTLGQLLGVEDNLQALCLAVSERQEAEEAKRIQAEKDAERKRADKEKAKRKQAEDEAKRIQAEKDAKRKQAEDQATRKQAEGEIDFWLWTGIAFGFAIGVLIAWAFGLAKWFNEGIAYFAVPGMLLGLLYVGANVKEAKVLDFIAAGIFGGLIGGIIGGAFAYVDWGCIGGGIGWSIGKKLHKWKNG